MGAFQDDLNAIRANQLTSLTAIGTVLAAVVAVGVLISTLTTEVINLNMLELSSGSIPSVTHNNKFGENTDIDASVRADIWDGGKTVGALPAGSSLIWVAPTADAVHNITSTSTSDDGDPVGVGARTVEIFGLTDWDTNEISETLTLNGTGNVATSNSYVIIHRMTVLTKGGTSINVGTITATATAPSATTVTARIEVGQGQTHMAILGVPSTQVAYMTQYYAGFEKAGGQTAVADVFLKVNLTPDAELINFVQMHSDGLLSVGNSRFAHPFNPWKVFAGPTIIKIQALSGTANVDMAAGFDVILVNK